MSDVVFLVYNEPNIFESGKEKVKSPPQSLLVDVLPSMSIGKNQRGQLISREEYPTQWIQECQCNHQQYPLRPKHSVWVPMRSNDAASTFLCVKRHIRSPILGSNYLYRAVLSLRVVVMVVECIIEQRYLSPLLVVRMNLIVFQK